MIKGIVFDYSTDGWSGRRTNGDIIENPIDQLEYILRNQNWSGYLTPQIKISGNGSFDSANLNSLRVIKSSRQLIDKEEFNTDYLIKSICKEFFLIQYQDNNGFECVDYMFKPRVSTFELDFKGQFDVSEIKPINKYNVFIEPFFNYAYDQATQKYTKTAKVLGVIGNTTWSASLTPGFSDNDGLKIWNKCRALYLKYGQYEPFPEELANKQWITEYVDLFWWVDKFYGLTVSGVLDWSRASIDIGYYRANYILNLEIGMIGTLNLPHQTMGEDKLIMIEGITHRKNDKLTTLDIILIDDAVDIENLSTMMQDTTDETLIKYQDNVNTQALNINASTELTGNISAMTYVDPIATGVHITQINGELAELLEDQDPCQFSIVTDRADKPFAYTDDLGVMRFIKGNTNINAKNLYVDVNGNSYLYGTESTLGAIRFRCIDGLVYLEKQISLTGTESERWKNMWDFS